MSKYFFLLALLQPFAMVGQQEFTKKKGHVRNKIKQLKDEVCNNFADVTANIPQLLRDIANLQEQSVDCLGQVVQGERNGLVATANEQELNSIKSGLENANQAIKHASQQLQKAVRSIKNISAVKN